MYEMDEKTVALLHFDDAIKDECGTKWENTGGAMLSDTSKMGQRSLYLNGTQYLMADNPAFAFGKGDFTIDWWMKAESTAGFQRIVSTIVGALTPTSLLFRFNNNGRFTIFVGGKEASVPFSSTDWNHIAVVRKSGTAFCYINGNLAFSLENADANITDTKLYIGCYYNYNQQEWYKGYIDEFRVSNVARWSPDDALIMQFKLTAKADDEQVSLSWERVDGAKSYTLKRSTTAGGPYATIATTVSDTSYVDKTAVNGTTYYYVVTALMETGKSVDSNEASAMPNTKVEPPVSKDSVLLRIVLTDSSEREYLLKTDEVNAFIGWYNRTVNTGNTCYKFADLIDGSSEYLAFEKIISFKTLTLK